MPRVRVGPKYQVVIPKAVRQKVRIRPGDVVDVNQSKGQINIRLDAKTYLDKYAGILAGAYDEFGGSEAYLEAERRSWDEPDDG